MLHIISIISLVQKQDCRASLTMTESSNDAPVGSLRGAQATKQSHVKSLIKSKDNYLVLDTNDLLCIFIAYVCIFIAYVKSRINVFLGFSYLEPDTKDLII